MENQEQNIRPFGRVSAVEVTVNDVKDCFMTLPSGGVPTMDPPDMAGIGLM